MIYRVHSGEEAVGRGAFRSKCEFCIHFIVYEKCGTWPRRLEGAKNSLRLLGAFAAKI